MSIALGAVAFPVAAQQKTWQPLPVRNIAPSLLASWLDPTHSLAQDAAKRPAPSKGAFSLPSGVEAIAPIDEKKILLVLGTPEALTELKPTVTFLDKPLRQVELEAQVIATNDKVEDFLRGNTVSGDVQVVFDSPKLQQVLALKRAGGLRVLTAPRVMATNNMATEMKQTVSQPVTLGKRGGDGNFEPLTKGETPSTFFVDTTNRLEVTPTINNDDTITVIAKTSDGTALRATNGGTLPLRKNDGLLSIVNIPDGDTVGLWNAKQKRLILLTARIVRQADK